MTHKTDTALMFRFVDRAALLSAPEERVKTDLELVANDVLADVRKISEAASDGASSTEITRCFNVGALCQYQYGKFDSAEQLCKIAIDLCLQYFRFTRDPEWISSLLQPYVNLGRLRAICGRTVDALACFRSVFLFVEGLEDLTIERETIPVRMSHEIAKCDPHIRRISTNAYIGDSVRACLLKEDYQILENFLLNPRHRDLYKSPAGRFLLEGEARYYLAVDQPRRALDRAVELWNLCRRDEPPDPSILGLICDIYLAGGRRDVAHSIADKMASYCSQLEGTEKWKRVVKRALYVLSLRYYFCDDNESAGRTALRGFAIARSLGDEPTTIRLACLVCKLQRQVSLMNSLTQECNSGLLRKLAATTFYRLEQILAYLELDAEGLDRRNESVPDTFCRTRVRQLMTLIGPIDRKKMRDSCAEIFEAELCMHEDSTEIGRVNMSAAVEHVYDALVDYASSAVRC